MTETHSSPFRLETDLQVLRALVAIADTGSFSAAAKRVGRTQSAVSLQIAKLEDRLQIQLLERTSRSVSQTAKGEVLIAYARRILALADEAATAISAPETQAPFRVGFAEYLAPNHVHDILGRFARAHPGLVFELKLATGFELRPALDRGEIDVLIAGPDGDGEQGQSRTGQVLLEEPIGWVSGRPASVPEDGSLPLVLMRAPCSYRKIALDALGRAGLRWHVVAETNSIQAVRSAVQAGLGISLLARSAMHGNLHWCPEGLPALPPTAMMAFEAVPPHPLGKRFIEFMDHSLRERPLPNAAA